MKITDHGEQRMRKRLGLPKKVVEKEFSKALENGKQQSEFKGRFRKYLDHNAAFYKHRPIVYNQNIYWVSNDNSLITVFPVPREFRKYV